MPTNDNSSASDAVVGGVGVVGAGVAGLTLAHALRQRGRRAVVFDGAAVAGGVMRTKKKQGYLLEQGPFNVLVRSEGFASLIDELGLAPAPVDKQAGHERWIVHRGRLRRVPSSPAGLLTAGALSPAGKLRLLKGLLRSAPRKGDGATTIDETARRRLGREAAERIASAMTVGIFAAESDELDFDACFPALASMDKAARSPLAWALARRKEKKQAERVGGRAGGRVRGMVSFPGGLGAFTGALAERLGADLRLRSPVERIERNGDGFLVSGAGFTHECGTLVLATGAPATAGLVEPLSGELATELRSLKSASLVVANLGFAQQDAGRLAGYGFLTPRGEQAARSLGALFASSVFPHHAHHAHHAPHDPAGKALVRVFFGGTRAPELVDAPDEEILAFAMDDLQRLCGVSGSPELVDIIRWPGAVPVYEPGHTERVARIRKLSAKIENVHLIGNYLDGVSVSACVDRALTEADAILAPHAPHPPHKAPHEGASRANTIVDTKTNAQIGEPA